MVNLKLYLLKKELQILIVSIFFALFVFFARYVIESIPCLQYALILFIVYILVSFLRFVKVVSCIMIFIYGFILFLCSRVFLSIFDSSILFESDKYVFYTFADTTVLEVLLILSVSFVSVIIGYLSSYAKSDFKAKDYTQFTSQASSYVYTDKQLQKILYYLILLSAPGVLYKGMHDLMLIKQYGYLIMFMEMPPAPLFARASWGFFNIVFPMLLMFVPSRKQFKYYCVLFFLVSSVSFLKGSRSTLLAPIVYFIWFYYSFYSTKKISVKNIACFILFVAFVAQGILFLRDKDASFNLSISQMLFALFYSQGATYVLLGNYLDYSSDFANSTRYSILFSLCTTFLWFFNPLYRKGQSEELVQHTLSLDDQLMYAVNPELYLSGVGYGSSYIAELYQLGGVLALIIGSYLIGRIIKWYERNYNKSYTYVYFSWFIIPHLIWTSRGSYFPSPFLIMIGVLFYVTLRSVVVTWNKRKLKDAFFNKLIIF